ncbi:GspE/PulE family protein [Gimesia fumaroli]|uniref:Type II secretion system protein E n=1 Tax=Gimesia fumaroli TaxID=2527976 RepID=A0A518I4V5_9PLAN|nr:GspE/PulE family protein [Gimesia fumaroli]QDV48085.1 Type II secretion system protein E [Gimesia fumaroli]
MQETLSQRFQEQLPDKPENHPEYVTELVDFILTQAQSMNASDIHLLPTEDRMRMDWRIDGVLHHITDFSHELAPRITSRLKVISQLLTYRTDVPQEGRIRQQGEQAVETRISTFPTLYGEKVVVRLFVGSGQYKHLESLNLPEEILNELKRLLTQTGGVVLMTGPAGSGKTTTIYACLREIIRQSKGTRSLASLEDPIEVVVPTVAQSQVNPAAGFDMALGLRSLLRQDPEVIMVGEIRDRETAETVFQASLSGHLVVTTFHAGSATEAVSRLSDMGIEPYLLRSGLLAILSQRLLRRLCSCATFSNAEEERLGLPVEQWKVPAGCADCGQTGYTGRIVLTEMLQPNQVDVANAILNQADANALHQLAVQSGMRTQWDRALEAVNRGITSPAEVRRVLGMTRLEQ